MFVTPQDQENDKAEFMAEKALPIRDPVTPPGSAGLEPPRRPGSHASDSTLVDSRPQSQNISKGRFSGMFGGQSGEESSRRQSVADSAVPEGEGMPNLTPGKSRI